MIKWANWFVHGKLLFWGQKKNVLKRSTITRCPFKCLLDVCVCVCGPELFTFYGNLEMSVDGPSRKPPLISSLSPSHNQYSCSSHTHTGTNTASFSLRFIYFLFADSPLTGLLVCDNVRLNRVLWWVIYIE